MNKMTNITIVGVGALGSNLIQFIRNEDINLTVIDMDRVEQKNIFSQFHGKTSIGKNKAQAIVQSMKFLFGRKIKALPRKLEANNADALLKDTDLIIDCLDNLEARKLVQDYARNNKINCIHGALAANGAYGQIVWDEKFSIDPEPGDEVPTCEDGEHLAFIGIVSCYLARAVHEFLDKGKKYGYQVNPTGAIRI